MAFRERKEIETTIMTAFSMKPPSTAMAEAQLAQLELLLDIRDMVNFALRQISAPSRSHPKSQEGPPSQD